MSTAQSVPDARLPAFRLPAEPDKQCRVGTWRGPGQGDLQRLLATIATDRHRQPWHGYSMIGGPSDLRDVLQIRSG